jgi:hypothetical protein
MRHRYHTHFVRADLAPYRQVRTEEIAEEFLLEFDVSGATSDAEIAVHAPVDRVVSLFISTSAAVTLKTNSASAPDDTLVLDPSAPLVWMSSFAEACPLTADVEVCYVTNATGSLAEVAIVIGLSA